MIHRRIEGFDRTSVESPPPGPWTFRRRMAESLACVDASLGARGGDRRQLEALQEMASRSRSETYCSLLAADRLEGEARLTRLEELASAPWPISRQAELLLADARPRPLQAERGLRRLDQYMTSTRAGHLRFNGLDQAALAALEANTTQARVVLESRAELRSRAAAFELFLGRFDEARRFAEGALTDLERAGADDRQWARDRLAVIELYSGGIDIARELLSDGGDPAARELLDFLAGGETDGEGALFRRHREAWRLIEAGDGAALAAWLRTDDHLRELRASTRPFWARRITSGRQELAEVLRWGFERSFRDERLTAALLDLSWDIQAARALGDDEWVSDILPTQTRLLEAVVDHLYPLELLAIGAI